MSDHTTVVINCAGTGSRLGFGMPKALLQFGKMSILQRHLSELEWHDDVRVVVGFMAEDVIADALKIRRDVVFVLNRDYRETGTMASLALGAAHGGETVVSVDGDLLLPPNVLTQFCRRKGSCMGVTPTRTEEGVLVQTRQKSDGSLEALEFVVGAGASDSLMEWSGLMKVPADFILGEDGKGRGTAHVYQTMESRLPIDAEIIDCCEVDTPSDYEQALLWAKDRFA